MSIHNILLKLKEFHQQLKLSRILIFGLLIILIPAILLFVKLTTPSLNIKGLSDYSRVVHDKETSYFVLQKDTGYIYKSSKTGIDAVNDFIKRNPSFKGKKLLLEDFDQDSYLSRTEKDGDDQALKKMNININNEHYFFEQKINNIPVFGSSLVVHIRNNHEIYSITGNLVNSQKITEQKITEAEARQIALGDALKEMPEIKEFKVSNSKKYIINKKILGISDDELNYLVLGLQIDSSNTSSTFSMTYFIDLEKGQILHKLSNIIEILNRQINNCASGTCQLVRSEGGPPVGDNDADTAHDYFGEVYNYYFNNFQRDSFDNNGSTLKGYVHASVPNAQWQGGTRTMWFRTGMVIRDVTGHEMTHGVVQFSAGLGGSKSKQSGALNESMADIFGSAIDNNWTMGEGSALGIIRYMNDPPLKGHPDRLFSPNYKCSEQVHANAGINNKAFYLMTDGGNFNGCSINGIGRQKSSAVAYRALTRYLTSTSNFKSMYNSLLQACNDLYSSGSPDCESVKSALQATEMDQQPDGSQSGAFCQNIPRQTPVCAGGAPLPTDSVTPTVTSVPGSSPTPTVTTAPTRFNISINIWTDNNTNGIRDAGDTPYQGATVDLRNSSGVIITSGISFASGNVTFSNLSPGNYSIKVTIQGFMPLTSRTLSIVDKDLGFDIFVPFISSLTPPVIVTQIPTLTPTLTSAPLPPGSASPTPKSKPTPTPIITFNCILDPKCVSGQKNLQFCPLICTPK